MPNLAKPVGLFERGRVILVADPAVERDIADDLHAVAVRAKHVHVVPETPDVVENEDERRFDFLDHARCLKGGKDIAAPGVGRVNGQDTVADRLPE